MSTSISHSNRVEENNFSSFITAEADNEGKKDNNESDDNDDEDMNEEDQHEVIDDDADDGDGDEDDFEDVDDDDEEESEEHNETVIINPQSNSSTKKARKKKTSKFSVAHDYFSKKDLILFHVDIEHGGEFCGVVQISCVAHDAGRNEDMGTFDSYINPGQKAIWDQRCSSVHGLHAKHEKIIHAQNLEIVWNNFVHFVEGLLSDSKKGVLVAWNGKSCDLEWFFKITHITNPDKCNLPKGLDYFMDPMSVIKHYKGCNLHNSKTKVEGYGLELTWCYAMNKQQMEGAHSAIVDAIAQNDIVKDDRFQKYIDKTKSIEIINELWSKKKENLRKKKLELVNPVPQGWSEKGEKWDLPRHKSYGGAEGGAPHGPTTAIKTICEKRSLADLFLFYFPMDLLHKIATQTNKYGNEDWVKVVSTNKNVNDISDDIIMHDDIENEDEDEDEEESNEEDPDKEDDEDAECKKTKNKMYQSCNSNDEGARHRHKASKKCPWRKVTPGYLLVFFGVLCVRGATKMRRFEYFYQQTYGTNMPIMQNSCVLNAFRQMRSHIHFVSSSDYLPKNHVRFHPLQKIKPIMDTTMKTMQSGYVLGMKTCVDESMIKYKGKFVSFVQYMPAKPIKHGIKVFALCCSCAGCLYSYVVCTGADSPEEINSPVDVVKFLIELAGCAGVIGRILYTDNYYTSMIVMKYLFATYGMLMIGTYNLTKKKSRNGADFPFGKISNAASRMVKRGWMRVAFQNVHVHNKKRRAFLMQATIWKDKKVVGFLHNYFVQPISSTFNVQRYSPTSRKKKDISSHPVVKEYSLHMNGVDNKDRDTADWGVSIKSKRHYMRIFYWIFDGILQAMFVVIKFVVHTNKESSKGDAWYRYKHLGRGAGRYEFQMDLGISLINKGLELDWGNPHDDQNEKPSYVRKLDYVPCGCKRCFFCKYNLTCGVDHATILKSGERKRSALTSLRNPKSCSMEHEAMSKKKKVKPCVVCHSRLCKEYPDLSYEELRPKIKHTSKGCRVCDQHVCASCWKDGFEHGKEHNAKRRKR